MDTLFIKTKSSWLIFESIKASEIIISTLFNLDFANDHVWSWFFLFFFISDLYFLIPAVITQSFDLVSELVIPIGIPIKEIKVEMETYLPYCSNFFMLLNH